MFDNPHFRQYVKLLFDLHEGMLRGADDASELDPIRDQMDEPGNHLSEEEIVAVKGVSADLYSLEDQTLVQPIPRTGEAQEGLKKSIEARNRGDFVEALALLRQFEAYADSASISFMRSRVWQEAGFGRIALAFLEHAAHITPEHGNVQYSFLDLMSSVDPSRARERAELILNDSEKYHPYVALLAAHIIENVVIERGSIDNPALLAGMTSHFEKAMARLDSKSLSPDDFNPVLESLAYARIASHFQKINDFIKAMAAYQKALELDPANDAVLTGRGILRYARETDAALRDLAEAVSLNSHLMEPYLFLAHHSLVKHDYLECLRYCRLALIKRGSDRMRAYLHEWAGISMASIGAPETEVEQEFREAIRFRPDDQRIRQNYAEYKQQKGRTTAILAVWSAEPESELVRLASAKLSFQRKPAA